MPDKQCPLCGNQISEDEILCNDCLEISHKRKSLKVVPDASNECVQQASLEPKISKPDVCGELETPVAVQSSGDFTKYSRSYFFIFLFSIIVCLAMGSIFFLVRKETKRESKTELDFWYSCIEKNTPAMYSAYLMKYPQGKFSNDASLKIGELRETERSAWEKIKKSTEIDKYNAFLRTYPDTPFKNEAKKIMDSLSWALAAKENTSESYNNYLENAQTGNIIGFYEGIARERYDYLSRIKELDESETAAVKKMMKKFFNTLSKQEYKHIDAFFGKIITNFYGARNRKASAIISSIAADMEKNKIKRLTYHPDFGSLQAYKDGNGLIVTEITVEKKIVYRHKKLTETIDEILCIELNPDMTIKSLYVKRKEFDDYFVFR